MGPFARLHWAAGCSFDASQRHIGGDAILPTILERHNRIMEHLIKPFVRKEGRLCRAG
jgi:hypothetical protein